MRLGIIAFLLGVCVLQRLTVLPSSHWCWLAPGLLAAAWRWPPLRPPAMAGVGFLWALLQASMALQHVLPPAWEGVDLEAVGRIASVPRDDVRRLRFVLRVDRLRHAGHTIPGPRRLRLSWYGRAPRLQAGDRWRLTVRLKRPSGLMNPGTFDYERWLFQHRIDATGYVRDGASNRRLASGWSLDRVRQRLVERLRRALGRDRNLGVITALAVGERDGISPAQWDLLNATGTSHLLAISGLHIGLVAGLAFVLMRWLWSRSLRLTLRLPAPKAAALAGLAAAAAYAALAGFSVPTQRALIMVAVAFGGLLLGRCRRPADSLAVALLLVLLWDPLAVLAAGFWLSFTAVAVILYGMSARVGGSGVWWRWGRVQWLVAAGLLPLSLVFFQRLSWIAPAANLVAVPWVSLLVVPLVLLGSTLLMLGVGLGGWVLHGAGILLNLLWRFLDVLAAVPMAVWSQQAPPLWAVLAAALGGLLLLAPRGFPARWLAALLWLPAFVALPPAPGRGVLDLTVLDVGQGLAVVARTRRHTLVYDAGPRFSASFDAGEAVVVPFLRNLGVRRIDRLVVSHDDRDHMGGVNSVLRRLAVDDVLAGVPEAVAGVRARQCRRGQSWTWDAVRFRVLSPSSSSTLNGNNRSCVLRIDAPGGSVLLTGDIQADVEKRLVAQVPRWLPVDVLVVPHHGSRTSSTAAFVHRVSPAYAVFTTGYRNRFGFPRPVVVARYRAAGAALLDSAADGAVRFRIGPLRGLGAPQRYRVAAGRYWNRHPVHR
ncbi:MAG: DNA internalization-related competence protein ComEC/Rec2 [Gammaproteobacteria bacterium]